MPDMGNSAEPIKEMNASRMAEAVKRSSMSNGGGAATKRSGGRVGGKSAQEQEPHWPRPAMIRIASHRLAEDESEFSQGSKRDRITKGGTPEGAKGRVGDWRNSRALSA